EEDLEGRPAGGEELLEAGEFPARGDPVVVDHHQRRDPFRATGIEQRRDLRKARPAEDGEIAPREVAGPAPPEEERPPGKPPRADKPPEVVVEDELALMRVVEPGEQGDLQPAEVALEVCRRAGPLARQPARRAVGIVGRRAEREAPPIPG